MRDEIRLEDGDTLILYVDNGDYEETYEFRVHDFIYGPRQAGARLIEHKRNKKS